MPKSKGMDSLLAEAHEAVLAKRRDVMQRHNQGIREQYAEVGSMNPMQEIEASKFRRLQEHSPQAKPREFVPETGSVNPMQEIENDKFQRLQEHSPQAKPRQFVPEAGSTDPRQEYRKPKRSFIDEVRDLLRD